MDLDTILQGKENLHFSKFILIESIAKKGITIPINKNSTPTFTIIKLVWHFPLYTQWRNLSIACKKILFLFFPPDSYSPRHIKQAPEFAYYFPRVLIYFNKLSSVQREKI